MRRSNRLLILIGIFLAVIAMVGVIAVGGGGGGGTPKGTPTPTPEPQVPVVIAKVDINLGEKIVPEMVGTQTMTKSERDALPAAPFTETKQVVGKTSGSTIKKGEIIYPDSMLQYGTWIAGQDLAPAIAPGRVAVSVDVDQINGVGTLITGGDHVDIVLSVWVDQVHMSNATATGTKVDIGSDKDVTTKMVIQNRKVLTVLLPSVQSSNAPQQAAAGTPTPQPSATVPVITNNNVHMVVIVEVLPEEAEVIRWAQREEKLDPQNSITLGLALRSDKDNDSPDVKTLGITFKELVTRYGVLPVDPRAFLPPDIATKISW